MNNLDIDHEKSVNGDDGGSWGGPVKFEDFEILSTGTGEQYGPGRIRMQGAIVGEKQILPNKIAPNHVYYELVDCSVPYPAVSLDLVNYDHFMIELFTSTPSDVARVGIFTPVTATGDPDREVKTGARFKLCVFCSAGQLNGLMFAGFAWIRGVTESDLASMEFSDTDAAIITAINIGTPSSPDWVLEDFQHVMRTS